MPRKKGGYHNSAGIRTDCLYLIGDSLFAYFQAQDPHRSSMLLASNPAYQAWHSGLASCIESTRGVLLEEVFYVE